MMLVLLHRCCRYRRVVQEREEKAVQEALARRETQKKLGNAVTTAKAAVWGTVEGVSVD